MLQFADRHSIRQARVTVLAILGALLAAMALPSGRVSAEQPSNATVAGTVVPAQPEDPTAAKAYAVFDRHCASCHQDGKVPGGKPAHGSSDILDLAALARDGARVRPGNPDGSPIYMLMQSRMAPHDQTADGKELAIEGTELDAVRDWIQSLSPTTACADRTTLGHADIAAAVAQALKTSGPETSTTHRFLTLTHLYNACATPAEMKSHRHAATLAVNSLSWGLRPAVLEAADPAGSILRLDLAAIGWDAERWDRLVRNYPYAGLDAAVTDAQTITGTPIPAVRADWFAAAALRPPLYYDLLGLPDRLPALTQSLRIDLNAEVAQGKARRIGIKSSTVARGSRLLQRSRFANGAFWTTYDYAPTAGRPDLFDAPAGPGSRGAPKADASLVMFALPSGFNAFFIANGDGIRLNDLPQSLVRDERRPSHRVAVGAGCLSCHSEGLQPATDELRARVQGDTAIPRDIREKVLTLAGPVGELQRYLEEDNERVASALGQAGLVPGTLHNGVDPVTTLIARYDRGVTLEALATELDVQPARLRALAGRTQGAAGDVLDRIVHGAVPRAQVEAGAPLVAAALGLRTGDAVVAPVRPDQQTEAAEPFHLVLKTGPLVYKIGELLQITARASENCYLTLINIDRNGRGTVVFPNDFEPGNYLEVGKDMKVPADGAPYQFRLRDPGRETIVGICQSASKTPPGLRHDFERQRFTELGDYRAFLNRTAANEPDKRPQAQSADPASRGRRPRRSLPLTIQALPRGEAQARAAAQIDVRP